MCHMDSQWGADVTPMNSRRRQHAIGAAGTRAGPRSRKSVDQSELHRVALRVGAVMRPTGASWLFRTAEKCCRRSLSSASELATADLGPFFPAAPPAHPVCPSPAQRKAASDLVGALRRHGFVYLTGTPLTPQLAQSCLAWSEWVFDLPHDVRSSIHTPDAARGWSMYRAASGDADHIEAFNMGNDDHTAARLRASYFDAVDMPVALRAGQSQCNRWPALNLELGQQFRMAMLRHFAACTRTAHGVLQALALGLDLPKVVRA